MTVTVPLLKVHKFIEIAKVMKPSIIVAFDNCIYSFDEEFSILKQITFRDEDFSDIRLCCRFKDLVDFVTGIKSADPLNDCVNFYYDIMYYKSVDQSMTSSVNYLLAKASATIEYIKNIQYNINTTISYTNLKDDENFNECMAIKSTDGATMYIKDGFVMTLFSGLLPANKSDNINLDIFDIDPYTFMSKFIVVKKKGMEVHVYVNYRKL